MYDRDKILKNNFQSQPTNTIARFISFSTKKLV